MAHAMGLSSHHLGSCVSSLESPRQPHCLRLRPGIDWKNGTSPEAGEAAALGLMTDSPGVFRGAFLGFQAPSRDS